MNMFRKMLKYPRLTQAYPKKPLANSDRFVGKPAIDPRQCTRCGVCAAHCPSRAIDLTLDRPIGINLDECIFCGLCAELCPTSAAGMTHAFELAETRRERLRSAPLIITDTRLPAETPEETGTRLEARIRKLYNRSLQIREVDAGSCNGCDNEINALNNPFNDIERFGIHFVASPRHADLLLVTGTATRNMELALIKTWNATPDPKLVIAVGACACSGGIFRDSYAVRNGIDTLIPVDAYIPGCPPRPQAILFGILKALERR
ncbi:MAG: NADH-quinone oxidoreductase subunit NuoB [Clostridiaceae bacterium]|nr:NADH-quinone oxidoreductase subunit NuoB [Clostridiaceae bacterium]